MDADPPVAERPPEVTITADAGVPLIRAFRSPRFRLVLALFLIALGIAAQVVLFSAAFEYSGTDANDFNAYRLAAIRLIEGESLYLPDQLAGAINASTDSAFLYPPFLAQVLAPIGYLPEQVASSLWYAIQLAAMWVAVWLASGLGGARLSVERALWTTVAVLLFMPVLVTLWYGNVSAVVALGATLVAFGGGVAGVAAAIVTIVKVSPIAYLPAVAVMGRRSLLALTATLLTAIGVGIVLAPEAWLDYPTVLMNLVSGSTDHGTNLAPATLAARAGLPDLAVSAVRLASLGIAGLCIVASVWAARLDDGRPSAALLATVAMLLVPGTLWYHYLAVLLPFAAMAWTRATSGLRLGLVLSAAVLSLSLGLEPLALIASSALVGFTLPVLWPARRAWRLTLGGAR